MFIPRAVLTRALPRLAAAGRPGAALIMAVAAPGGDGVPGRVADLENLLTGGGTLGLDEAAGMLTGAGFRAARPVELPNRAVELPHPAVLIARVP
jgi:hypothetical protein